ncbi:MAG: CDP-alcohol phosphatidyltransferase family protein [Candidatus Binatia bacterium]|nr:CDP-alcohol phosphatidyltransferase family protein [Candidatus Binatia bacterium]
MGWHEVLLSWAIFGFIGGTAVWSLGRFHQEGAKTGQVGGSLLLGERVRSWYVSFLDIIVERCASWRVQPTHLSFAQLFLSAIVAVAIARGMLFTGGWLLLVTGTLDIIDGRLARRTNGASLRGAFLDSVIDRYADSLGYVGLAVYFRDSWVLWLTLLAMIGSLMVSYTRARAEGLGESCRVGLLQRPERYVILGFGCMFSVLLARMFAPFSELADNSLLIVVLFLLALLVNATAVQRALHVWRKLGGPREQGN